MPAPQTLQTAIDGTSNVYNGLRQAIHYSYRWNAPTATAPADSCISKAFWYWVWRHNVRVVIVEGANIAASKRLKRGNSARSLEVLKIRVRSSSLMGREARWRSRTHSSLPYPSGTALKVSP
jgi:hypothetical protein